MSDHVPPDKRSGQTALTDLSRLIRHLGDELASYRRRALSAEARLKALEEQASESGLSPEQSFEIGKENQELRARLDEAEVRTKVLLERVRFLRQQEEAL